MTNNAVPMHSYSSREVQQVTPTNTNDNQFSVSPNQPYTQTMPETGIRAQNHRNEVITAAAVLAAGTTTVFKVMKRRKQI